MTTVESTEISDELPGLQAPKRQRPYFDLLLISFLILFFELACIRWFGSMVVYLTFFTNIVLTACFLGMSVGCLAASRRRNYLAATFPITLIAVLLAIGTLLLRARVAAFDVGGQR